MGKKRVRNTFGYSKPGQKKLTRNQAKEEKINKPDENKDSGLGQELLNKLAKADERLNKLASDQEVCYKNLAMVNAQITAWNHERHKLVKQLKELVGA